MPAPGPEPQTAPSARPWRPGAGGPWRVSRWSLAVAASMTIVLVVALALGIGWLASLRTTNATYGYANPLRQVVLRLSAGSVTVVGSSSSTLEVRRTDHYAFGHAPSERRTSENGVLKISSSCPRILVGNCSASYELAVPETVALDVQTTSGDVRLDSFRGTATVRTRSGDFDAEAYCGFGLAAASASGDLHVAAACAPARLQLQTGSGDVTALVPPGRYRIGAHGARTSVTGLTNDPNAPFAIEATSASGSVAVGGGL
jgi:hypothetical protein